MLREFVCFKFAIVGKLVPGSAVIPIVFVPNGNTYATHEGYRCRGLFTCHPEWRSPEVRVHKLCRKSRRLLGNKRKHFPLHFVEVFKPEKTYDYNTKCD